MKKIATVLMLALMMLSCSAGRNISVANAQNYFDAEQVFYTQYPELVQFYENGLIKLTSLKENVNENGIAEYDVKYKFVRHYYRTRAEKAECLRENFPDMYVLYVNGNIEVTKLYKYVDLRTMTMKHYVSYVSYQYVPMIYPYGGYRYHYVPRVILPRPTPHRPPHGGQPRPPHGHGPRR